MRNSLLFLALISLTLANIEVNKKKECKPRQVRLLFGEDYANYQISTIENTATIIFQTYGECTQSLIEVEYPNSSQPVQYSPSERIHSKWDGEKFCHNNKMCSKMHYDQYAHVFRLPIPQNVHFSYTVVGAHSNSKGPFTSILPSSLNTTQRILFFGDQDSTIDGKLNMKRWRQLKKQSKKHPEKKIDSFMFLGDYAYEFYMFNGKRGDHYLDNIEEFASEWPTLFIPGNHEDNYNYTFFNQKFRLPNYNLSNNHYFSINQGLAHLVGVNLHFYDNWASSDEKQAMISWVEQDLIKANAHRKQTPWIIVFGHKPIYCSQDSSCPTYPGKYTPFDELFHSQNVDLFLSGHVHDYQFMKPLYQNNVQPFQGNNLHMIQPQGIIQVVQGNGGHILEGLENIEQTISFLGKKDVRVAELHNYVGYGILEIYNSTTLCIQNIESRENKVKSNHCVTSSHDFKQANIQHNESDSSSVNPLPVFLVALAAGALMIKFLLPTKAV